MEFEDWYGDHYPRVLAVLTVVASDEAVAQRATAEPFVAAYERWERIRAMEEPTAWLYDRALGAVRREERWHLLRSRRASGGVTGTGFEGDLKDADLKDAGLKDADLEGDGAHPDGAPHGLQPELWTATRQLSRPQRTAVALRYVLGLPEANVARLMGVARGTATASLAAGRRNLYGALDTLLPREEGEPDLSVVDLEAEFQPLLERTAMGELPPMATIRRAARLQRRRRHKAAAGAVAACVALVFAATQDPPEDGEVALSTGQVGDASASGSADGDGPAELPLAGDTGSGVDGTTTTTEVPPEQEPEPEAEPQPEAEAPEAEAPEAEAPEAEATEPAEPTPVAAVEPAQPPASQPAPVLSSTIEDTSVGSGIGQVSYSGASWTRCGGCDIATPNGSYYYGFTEGHSYTIRFRGVRLKVFAPSDRLGGTVAVTVDGRPAATPTVDFLTSGIPVDGLRWDSGTLTNGDHTVTFTIQGGRANNVALFDRAEVYTPG